MDRISATGANGPQGQSALATGALIPSVAAGNTATPFGASPRLLVIRLRRFGDLLLATPTLRAIRLGYPTARIEMLVQAGFHHVLAGNPHIDDLLVLEPGFAAWGRLLRICRQRNYDAVLDLQSSSRSAPFVLASSARIRVGWRKRSGRDWVYNRLVPGWNDPIYVARNTLRLAAAIGAPPPRDLRLELAVSAAERANAAHLFARAGIDTTRPIIGLSVVASAAWKAWPLESYAVLADRLIKTLGAQVVFTNGPGELEQVRAVVKRMHERPTLWDYGQTTIQELGALYERCHLWIGNDGGPKHVATAVGCPTIVIISSGNERVWTECGEGTGQVAVHAPPAIQPRGSLAAAVGIDEVYEAVSRYLGGAILPAGDGDLMAPTSSVPAEAKSRSDSVQRRVVGVGSDGSPGVLPTRQVQSRGF
jgi:heptosyltransferase-2